MNISEVLNLWAIGWGFGAAVAVLLLGAAMELGGKESSVARAARNLVVPAAVGLGIVVAYALTAGWSGGKGERPWWQGEARQMLIVAAAVSALLVGIMCQVRGWAKWVLWVVLGIAMMLVVVRGPWMGMAWEGWAGLAACVPALFLVYGMALAGVIRGGTSVERLWLVPLGVMWVTTAAAGVSVMPVFDMAAGQMFVYLAVMAGLAIVAGIWKRWRASAAWAGVLIAAVYAGAWTSAAFFDRGADWALPQAALGLLAAGPVGTAVSWVPGLRRRPWLCVFLAMGLAAMLVAPAVIVAANAARSIEG